MKPGTPPTKSPRQPPLRRQSRRDARSLTPRPLRQFRFRNGVMLQAAATPADAPLGFVKYDPSAADFILKNKLISTATLNKLIVSGQIGNVPALPNTSIALKVQTNPAAPDPLNPGYHKLNVWPGPPNPAKGSGEGSWPNYVWIDLNPKNPSTGDGSSGVTRTPANTYSINDILHFTNNGAISIVVGMHVTTREATDWSWQTFWWTPEATRPPQPSSHEIARVRPEKLLKMGARGPLCCRPCLQHENVQRRHSLRLQPLSRRRVHRPRRSIHVRCPVELHELPRQRVVYRNP